MKLKVIYKASRLAGIIWRDALGYHFDYEDDFIADGSTFPISVNMPKSQKKYTSDRLFANFQSMLSEGYNRELQCRALGIDLNDEWSLLMNTCGKDTIGAITIEKSENNGIL